MTEDQIERRARELMLNPADKAAYLRLLKQGERSEFQVTCPDCHVRMETYEANIWRHIHSCAALRAASAGE